MNIVSLFHNRHLKWPKHILDCLLDGFESLLFNYELILLDFHPVDVACVVEPH